MSQQGKSTPKMRKAFTPRVKSAQNIRQPEPNKYLFNTENKYQPEPFINPQKIQDPVAKKLNLHISQQKNKFDVPPVQTEIDSPIKINKFFSNGPKAKASQIAQLKRYQIGRNMQWPANDRRAHNPNQGIQNREEKISRCMSAHTMRSNITSRSQKTDQIKQSRKQFDQKFNVAFDYLLTQNNKYLQEKISMCNQKARPKQQIFTIKRPSLHTTNKDFYKKNQDKHKLVIEPQNQKMSLLMSQLKVCGNSMSKEFHQGKKGSKADLVEWREGFKLEGPICEITTNSNAFPNHGSYQKMVPIVVFNEHPLGIKHRESATNSRLMKGEFAPRAELAKWNNLNPLANDLFNPQKGTIYEKQFGRKQKQPIQQWPMPQHKLIVTDGIFKTSMKSSFLDFNKHELSHSNSCKCGRNKH